MSVPSGRVVQLQHVIGTVPAPRPLAPAIRCALYAMNLSIGDGAEAMIGAALCVACDGPRIPTAPGVHRASLSAARRDHVDAEHEARPVGRRPGAAHGVAELDPGHLEHVGARRGGVQVRADRAQIIARQA